MMSQSPSSVLSRRWPVSMRFGRRGIVSVALRAPTQAADHLFLAGNLLLLYCFVPPLSLATFFAVSALLVYIKSFVPACLRGAYLTAACTILVATLILYHRA